MTKPAPTRASAPARHRRRIILAESVAQSSRMADSERTASRSTDRSDSSPRTDRSDSSKRSPKLRGVGKWVLDKETRKEAVKASFEQYLCKMKELKTDEEIAAAERSGAEEPAPAAG